MLTSQPRSPLIKELEAIDDEALDAVTGGTLIKPVNTTIT